MTRTAAFGLTILAAGGASFALAVAVAAQTPAPSSSGPTVQLADRWVCRRADADHPKNATTADNVALNCRPVNVGIPMTTGGMMLIGSVQARPANAANQPPMVFAPTLSDSLTPAQLNDSWHKFVRQALQIPDVPLGGG